MRLKFTTSGRGELAVGHIGWLHRGSTVFLQVTKPIEKARNGNHVMLPRHAAN
jgi:hypothetical protein